VVEAARAATAADGGGLFRGTAALLSREVPFYMFGEFVAASASLPPRLSRIAFVLLPRFAVPAGICHVDSAAATSTLLSHIFRRRTHPCTCAAGQCSSCLTLEVVPTGMVGYQQLKKIANGAPAVGAVG